MPSFHDRYLRGEHEAVWADLVALGNGVHRDSIHSDALAVARETMSRARMNIETLIVRLDQIGYQFETARGTPPAVVQQIVDLQRTVSAQLHAQYPELLANSSRNNVFEELLSGFDPNVAPASILDEQSVYCRAQDWSIGCISGLESYLRGPLPVSLRAWYENIEHVSFIGTHPVLNPASQEQGAVPGPARTKPSVLPDPLALMPLPDEVDYESWETPDGYPIAVDEFFKAKINRDHRYHIDFRDVCADTRFQDWRNDYFVVYLRRVFKWGGFPGWERHPNPPLRLITELTDGLLAI